MQVRYAGSMDSTPSRRPLALRLSPEAITRFDALAHEHSLPGAALTRTDVIRAHLMVASRHRDELVAALKQMAEAKQ